MPETPDAIRRQSEAMERGFRHLFGAEPAPDLDDDQDDDDGAGTPFRPAAIPRDDGLGR